jgi:hypothetical protein
VSIANNLVDNAVNKGQLMFDAQPGALWSEAGKGAILGVGGEVAG